MLRILTLVAGALTVSVLATTKAFNEHVVHAKFVKNHEKQTLDDFLREGQIKRRSNGNMQNLMLDLRMKGALKAL